MGRLQNKTAIVVGASSPGGLGEAIARRYAKEGARVVVSGRRMAPLEALAGEIGGLAVACDITGEDSIAALVAAAQTRFGRLDIAVNSAGDYAPATVAALDYEALRHETAVHYLGPVMFIKHCANAMAASGGGAIITLSSLTVELTGAALAAYAGAKAGVDKVVRIAALEYGPARVRINSLAPGLVKTPMTAQLFAAPSIIKVMTYETPLGALCTAEEVAAAALWLADDECTMTGDLLRVSGGGHLRRLPTQEEMMGTRP
jgi:NAD(P)-dependent dehydrogenase (short-subunit alcohol dehydrogenase family)